MDLLSLIYSFVLALGARQFVVNETSEVSPTQVEVDVETLNLRENKRYILLIEDGRVVQQARVPLTDAECRNPH